jgi:hypothetical protein
MSSVSILHPEATASIKYYYNVCLSRQSGNQYCSALTSGLCRFSAAGNDNLTRVPAAGGRKPPRHEIVSGDGTPAVPAHAAGCVVVDQEAPEGVQSNRLFGCTTGSAITFHHGTITVP